MQTQKIEGKIIEFIEEGHFTCALCLSKKRNRIHVLTCNNKEINISVNRILCASKLSIDISKPRSELLEYISNAEKEREMLKKKVNVKELWELVKDEKEVFGNEDLAQLVFGKEISDAHVSAVMRALFEDKLYFKLKDGLFIPHTEEQIAAVMQKKAEEERKKELVEKGSIWIKNILEGKEIEKFEFADHVTKILSDIFLFGKEAKDYEIGKEILSKIGVRDAYLIKDILVKLGVWEEDENIELIKKNIPLSFSVKIKNEVEKIKRKRIDFKNRKILEDLEVFTIDSEDTKDFDDALSIEQISEEETKIGIHIADVSEWIPANSVIDLEARKRGSSCYLPRRQIPMIPEELSHEFLSLKKGEPRLAVSLFIKMDCKGNIKDYEFVPTVIKVKEQFSYDAVDKILKEGKDEKLCELYRIATILREKRIRKGAINISLPEVKIIFGEKELFIKLIPQDTPAHTIVAEFMILYNWLCAKMCFDKNIPVLFRTQDKTIDIVPAQEGENKIYHAIQQIRKFGPMLISTSPAPHNVLGLDVYTQATSPLRRYLDLVVQRQIKSYILKKVPVYTTKELEEIRMEVEPVVRELQTITKNRIRYWTIKYLAQHIGEKQKAIVLDELKKKYRVILPDILLTAEIKKKSGVILAPGTEVWVVVKKADPWKDTLELEYA